jgi:C-terminal processing protease CtpA/Prc
MFKGACATVFMGLVLQGYISNIGKPGYIGIMATTCPPIKVTEVFHGTPAERAGLKVNDHILKVDGDRSGEIKGQPNTKVTLMLKRGEDIFNVTITRAPVDEMPPEFPRGTED